jgi:hypothetical protein
MDESKQLNFNPIVRKVNGLRLKECVIGMV